MAIIVVRVIVLAVATGAGLELAQSLGVPPGKSIWFGGGGLLLGLLAVLLEWQARHVPVERLLWGATGGMIGVVFGLALGSVLGALVPGADSSGRGLFAVLLAYLGSALALAKAGEVESISQALFPRRAVGRESSKILDTSVIIDGRIVEVCESGFIEGPLLVPQFVLHELQHIADSADALKRNRAKRGFEALQRLQRLATVDVRIEARDFPHIREVDRKLLELARTTGGKVVTNDYALNKLAEVMGVAVLNVNELASALRPAVMPGEPMQVHLVKEGKEAGQGIAYLGDGTMVVVDHGKRFIGQTVDVAATTILQTSAGRMIFARLRDDEPAPR